LDGTTGAVALADALLSGAGGRRVVAVAGSRVRDGIPLDNAKPNASVLLSEVGQSLRDGHGVREFVMFQKGYFGTPVEESLIQQILHQCDFVVAGIGD
jgi:hypothetical protein